MLLIHVLVLGAGVGGLAAALDLRSVIPEAQVSVVANSPWFQFTPSNPWVAVGWRDPEDVKVDIRPVLERRGIRFDDRGARRLHPERNQVELGDGTCLDYDFLVVATGPRLAFDEVDGLGPDAHTASMCRLDHAARAYEQWQGFVQDPGPIVVGAVPGASCFEVAYESAFIMDADLRRRQIRDRVPMTFVTAEPYVGHFGLGGVADSRGVLESELRQREIAWICNARVERVEAGRMHVTEVGDDGAERRHHTLDFRHSLMLPAFSGVDAVRDIDGLVDDRGFVLVDRFQRNPCYSNVYGVGVSVSIPAVEATPVPTGVSKTGYMIETMASAAVANIRAAVDGREPYAEATWNTVCVADMGDTGLAFVAVPQIPPRNLQWIKKGKWVRLAKMAFEKYFLRKVRNGVTEHVVEKHLLKAMGIGKLK